MNYGANRQYILDPNRKPVPEPDLLTWARWMEELDSRRVAEETVGSAWVSTIFLGLDHNYRPSGPPVLWESMVFGGLLDHEQNRCSGSWEQAEAMHADMVERVKAIELLGNPKQPTEGNQQHD